MHVVYAKKRFKIGTFVTILFATAFTTLNDQF